MNPEDIASQAAQLAAQADALSAQAQAWAGAAVAGTGAEQAFVPLLAVFMLACFVGYYVVWHVTPALHSPLMGVTNAISSVVIVGAMLATGLVAHAPGGTGLAAQAGGRAAWFGFAAVLLASVNIFGGFAVTARMLSMFKARGPGGAKPEGAKPGGKPPAGP